MLSATKSYLRGWLKAFVGRGDPERTPAGHLLASKALLYDIPSRPHLLTSDLSRVVPLLHQILDGTLRDTDELLAEDPEGYAEIYSDEHISTQIDNLLLPVAQASWRLQGHDPDSDRLVPYLEPLALRCKGWQRMILELSHCLITGVRIVRPVWERRRVRGHVAFTVKRWNVKDKRRFRPGDPDWENLYLIDPGNVSGSVHDQQLFARRVPRRWYLVARWRDTEERLGWGRGIGALLYRLRKIRTAILRILFRSVEAHAGGVRVISVPPGVLRGRSPSEQSQMLQDLVSDWKNAESGDTVAFGEGITASVYFPEHSVGRVIQEVVDQYVDKQVTKLLLGVTLTTDQGSVGSYELGKVHSHHQWMRMQYIADFIAEVLDTDWVPTVAEYNPWIYDAAGVPRGTALPQVEARVQGAESLQQLAAVWNNLKVPVDKAAYLREITGGALALATPEQVERGEAFVPALVGASAGGGSGGMLDGLDLAGLDVGAGDEPIAAVESPTIQDAALMYERAVTAGDRWLADAARRKLAAAIGEPEAPPISDGEWAEMRSSSASASATRRSAALLTSADRQRVTDAHGHEHGADGKFVSKGGSGDGDQDEDQDGDQGEDQDEDQDGDQGEDQDEDQAGDQGEDQAGDQGSEKAKGKGKAAVKKALKIAWATVNAMPKVAEAIVKETGVSPRVAKIAMVLAMIGDWSIPGLPAGSVAVSVLASLGSGGKAPVAAAKKAIAAFKAKKKKAEKG